ncbi:MAG: selenide, water dikinase [Cyanobacteria bacterium RYN_339]|nr:selenide, water dikinase [Cyanobacteria bacterium RYN_339]
MSQEQAVRLTSLAKSAGCAAKVGPGQLSQVLGRLQRSADPRLLVGFETNDDAGVFQLTPELALVQTVDFFPPMVDDPYTFGAIAAANALSDIYAMGGTPLTALNILAFPTKTLPLEVLAEILRGGADKAAEAGVAVLGGHSVEDEVPKYGMAVTGTIHPQRILTNAGAQAGDRLLLTKRIGVGLLTTGIKRGLISPEGERAAIASMAQLNKLAGEVLARRGAHACTDITGFGLLGHLNEMARGSNLRAEIRFAAVPIFEEALALARADEAPGGTERNLAYVEQFVTFAETLDRGQRLVLADAQTSGGLLIATNEADTLKADLEAAGVTVWEIGRMVEGSGITVA